MTTTTIAPPQRRESQTPEHPTVSDVLNRAADLLEEFGWCQGHGGSKKEGVFCIRGAIAEAHYELKGEHIGVMCDPTILNVYEKQYGVPSFAWNDSRGRKKSEVVAALREAASLAQ
jgi:hypothetical protein